MRKIGLVTLFHNNYGSILQCYSTKTFFEQNGIRCDVLEEFVPREQKIKYTIKRLFYLIIKAILYPSFIKEYSKARQASKKSNINLSEIAYESMNLFVRTKIKPLVTDKENLKELAKKDNYIAFVSGSDQIWNCTGMINKTYFLDFAPKSKSISLSASFGRSDIPSYFLSDVKRLLKSYKSISVREYAGKKMITELLSSEVTVLADPVLLKTKEEWREEYKTLKDDERFSEPYVLCFFLDKPNEIAQHYVSESNEECKFVEFGYHYDIWSDIVSIDGNPFLFLKLLDNAERIYTDSFHAVMFSIIFGKEFFVFERQYKHEKTQQSRIDTVLKKYDYESRLIKNKGLDLNGYKLHDCESVISQEREQLLKYISENIVNFNDNTKLSKKNKYDCTYCGLCKKICPVNSIVSVNECFGYSVYEKDLDKCVSCGKCDRVCNLKHCNYEEKKAYVAYNCDEKMREQSASGGVFSALAKCVLDSGGCVYGASMMRENGKMLNKHVRIDEEKNLYRVLGSKYVESDISNVFDDIKKQLVSGKLVLFSGTSCQVNAVYSFLSNMDLTNLYTVDLICHGVPGEKFFYEYVQLLEKKYKGIVNDIKFRKKHNGIIEYVLEINLSRNNRSSIISIPLSKSIYYYLFMRGESYRESCYNCEYSSIDKPADITLGDYFELKNDNRKLFDEIGVNDISAVIVHNKKGKQMLERANIFMIDIPCEKIVESHDQLVKNTDYTSFRKNMINIYTKFGMSGLAYFYSLYYNTTTLAKKILKR